MDPKRFDKDSPNPNLCNKDCSDPKRLQEEKKTTTKLIFTKEGVEGEINSLQKKKKGTSPIPLDLFYFISFLGVLLAHPDPPGEAWGRDSSQPPLLLFGSFFPFFNPHPRKTPLKNMRGDAPPTYRPESSEWVSGSFLRVAFVQKKVIGTSAKIGVFGST